MILDFTGCPKYHHTSVLARKMKKETCQTQRSYKKLALNNMLM